jgi:hypothetical protein
MSITARCRPTLALSSASQAKLKIVPVIFQGESLRAPDVLRWYENRIPVEDLSLHRHMWEDDL